METVEFLQSQWANQGNFINHGDEKDPMIGINQGKGIFIVPGQEIRHRYRGLETFNVLPGLKSLEWISNL